MAITKQQAIQYAYEREGFDWEFCKENVDENGFHIMNAIYPEINETNFNIHKNDFRPKSLLFLETNNNWTIIKTARDLPDENCFCRVILNSGRETMAEYVKNHREFLVIRSGYIHYKNVQHYQRIEEIKKPLFNVLD